MGVAITEILLKKEIDIDFLKGKTLVVDSPMWLYQFLSSIRQRDGSLLTDSKGNVTSHLMGLISRVSNLAQQDIKLAFVFDGKPHKLKLMTLEKRKEIKQEAEKKLEEARKIEDYDLMKKFAPRTSRLTKEMIEDSRILIDALGFPVINAPSEAEAQASYIVRKGDAYALSTNDADALLFGATRIVRNLNMAGKRKKMNSLSFETISPDLVVLEENLQHLGLTQDQLICVAMLVGTDFNAGGIKGTGPKTALKLVKKCGNDFGSLFSELKWEEYFEYPWQEVFELIKNMPIDENYEMKWKNMDEAKIMRLLVDEHDFSAERVKSQIDAIRKSKETKAQKGLNDFFG